MSVSGSCTEPRNQFVEFYRRTVVAKTFDWPNSNPGSLPDEILPVLYFTLCILVASSFSNSSAGTGGLVR